MASDKQDVAYVGDMRLSRIDNTWYSNGFFTGAEALASMRDCDVGNNDILLASFPKSGEYEHVFYITYIYFYIKLL